MNKPKLRTYVKVKDFDNPACLVKIGMSRCQRSLIAQLLCGILPLKLEVGRYLGTDKRFRYCKVCGTKKVEDEIHFIFDCRRLKEECKGISELLSPHDRRRNKRARLCMLLSPNYIKRFAMELEKLYAARQKILYK